MKFPAYVKTVFLFVVLMLISGCEEITEIGLPSQVAILNPADGSVLTEQMTMNFSIVNDDNLSYTQIVIDGTEVGRLSKGQTSWNFTPAFYNDGLNHTLIAITTDSDDQQNQSDVVQFSVSESAMLSPVYTVPDPDHIYLETENVSMSWDQIPNAVEYTVQLSEDKYFGTILSESTVTGTSVSFGVLPKEAYYTRMSAKNVAGKTAAWSNNRKIYVGIFDITWQNVYDFPGPAWANDVIVLPDSTFVSGGPCYDSYLEYAKMSLVKTDRMGNIVWEKLIGAENAITYLNSISYRDGYIYLVGGEANPANYDSKLVMVKTDTDGNVIWRKTYGAYDSWGYKASITEDGSIYITCDYDGERSLLKLSSEGTIIYSYTPGYYTDWLYFTFDPSGNLIVMYGDYDDISHLVKLNESGEPLSDTALESLYIYSARGIAADAEGIYIIYSGDNITKLGYDGTVLYEYSDYSTTLYSLKLVNGSLYASGYDYYGNACLFKISTTLTSPVIKSYGTGVLTNLRIMDDGSAILCGFDTYDISSNTNMLLIRTDKDGNCDEKFTPAKTGTGTKLKVKYDRIK
ncbi:TPA: hypothetical protein DCR49_05495 [Candidatus Delongbacteria bacterium]|nr:MAG: hypothetical protein A2Y39_03565 [Candidatus Delongbacteria bacterium GWF2_40_14]HAQ61440.1 hypothetical protein [Candidatus Delongbacteria bacterium]